MKKELDTAGICDLDPNDNTIQFSKDGYYKITFTINAYVPYFNSEFDPKIDFVSVGFRLVGTVDDIFIGDSQWIYDESSLKLVGQGIITVPSIANAYELVNLSKRSIYLNTPELKYINTKSYFSNSTVTIIAEYLVNKYLKLIRYNIFQLY